MESITGGVSVIFLLRRTATCAALCPHLVVESFLVPPGLYATKQLLNSDLLARVLLLLYWMRCDAAKHPPPSTIFEYYSNSKFANYLCIPFFFAH